MSSTSTSASEGARPVVAGTWYDATSSRGTAATLGDAGGGLRLELDGREARPYARDAIAVSDRIGNIPRRVSFPDGGSFETTDNDGIDALLGHASRGSGLVHWLEARWPVAIAALALVAVASVLFVRYGVPVIAERVALRVPDAVAQNIGDQALAAFDGRLLHPTRLAPARQAELQRLFAAMTDGLGGARYRLELRDAARLGPNAVALPARTVVMTDQLVALAEDDEELLAVLAHELGHLEARHSLRLLLQSAGVSALAVALFGDVSALYAVASAAPLLLQAKHSRDFEREADGYARGWLRRAGIGEARFDAILCRLDAAQPRGTEERAGASDVFDYLATHPRTDERAHCPPRPEG